MGHVISVPIYRSDANGQNRGRYISSWNTFNSARSVAARHTNDYTHRLARYIFLELNTRRACVTFHQTFICRAFAG